jgi:NADPH-dependent curcumin reductase CurA
MLTIVDIPRWGEAINKLADLYKAGKLQNKTTVYKGIESVPDAFVDMFAGKNFGKMLIDVTRQ